MTLVTAQKWGGGGLLKGNYINPGNDELLATSIRLSENVHCLPKFPGDCYVNSSNIFTLYNYHIYSLFCRHGRPCVGLTRRLARVFFFFKVDSFINSIALTVASWPGHTLFNEKMSCTSNQNTHVGYISPINFHSPNISKIRVINKTHVTCGVSLYSNRLRSLL